MDNNKKKVFEQVFSHIDGTPWDDVPNALIDAVLTGAGYWELQEQVKLLREALIAAQPYLPGVMLTRDVGQCLKCGAPTNSGLKKYCPKCLFKIIRSALAQSK